jgi:hypothetical protein
LCAQGVSESFECEVTPGAELCGGTSLRRVQDQLCSGQRAACDGELVWRDPEPADLCTSDQSCDGATGRCAREPRCEVECQDDAGCSAEQHCREGVCLRDLCAQGEVFCEGLERRQCDARGAGSEVLEACAERCEAGACVSCPENACSLRGQDAGSFCDGELVTCGLEGRCAVELARQICTDPTPLCDVDRCVGCLESPDCPSSLQTCVERACVCQAVCSLGERGCVDFSRAWTCALDAGGCEARVSSRCDGGRVCDDATGDCVCPLNACQALGQVEGEHCDGGRRVRCGDQGGCAVEFFSQECACGCEAGACLPCGEPDGAYVALGTGDLGFVALEDGDEAGVYAGFQGGHHVFGAIQAYGFTQTSGIYQKYTVTEDGNLLTTWEVVSTLRPVGDHHEIYGITVAFPRGTQPASLDGRRVTLSVLVRTPDNRSYNDAREIVLVYPGP